LTLETVDPDERTYLWSEYAAEPRMRANLGIRRRLAPLLEHDLDRTQLATALLLSLPGSPVLYYGDEIGMGDNIWLPDRDGVRTPMHSPSPVGCCCRSTWTRSTATKPPTSRPSSATRLACCTGPDA
jgi:glycosidase